MSTCCDSYIHSNAFVLTQPDGAAPTGQQKRKHQLTYLAHEVSYNNNNVCSYCPPPQAKANELKLLKQWGQSAASRRDTQMKYGF